METHNFCPRPATPITDDGKVDVTEYNFPTLGEIEAARNAVKAARSN